MLPPASDRAIVAQRWVPNARDEGKVALDISVAEQVVDSWAFGVSAHLFR
jgi:hypothetical protein